MKNAYCLVIDACIAQGAGTNEISAQSEACRETLDLAKKHGHRLAWSEEIAEEWGVHASGYSLRWWRVMQAHGRLHELGSVPCSDALSTAIAAQAANPGERRCMMKDAHLLAAAAATDRRVISTERRCVGHFRRLARSHAPIQAVMWVDPTQEEPDGMAWLKAGAKEDSGFYLMNLTQDDND